MICVAMSTDDKHGGGCLLDPPPLKLGEPSPRPYLLDVGCEVASRRVEIPALLDSSEPGDYAPQGTCPAAEEGACGPASASIRSGTPARR
jgi:hypothetical protein